MASIPTAATTAIKNRSRGVALDAAVNLTMPERFQRARGCTADRALVGSAATLWSVRDRE